MFTHIPQSGYVDLKSKFVNGVRVYSTPIGPLPSITSVLSSKEKPEIEQWRQLLGKQKADKETERCAERGTEVHALTEKYLKNEEIDKSQFEASNVRLFNQIKPVLNRIQNIRIQEGALYSEVLKVAGRVDCIAEYQGSLSVIDFKTSNNNKTNDMVEDYFLQETFYALAYMETFFEPITQIVTIMAVEKGLTPLIWKRPITPYVVPLSSRIQIFYKDHPQWK